VTPDFITPFSAKPAIRSTCEAYRELIEQGLVLGRNGKAIWQDLVSDHGFAGDYQTVKRFVRKLRGPQRPEAAGIILTAPGEEAQVDYGSGPMVRDAQSGKYRRTRLFVLTLGHSRKSVRLLTWRSSVRTWAELHEKAFRRLGGCPKVVVLDNLKEGVAVPDLYDPTVNPLFRDVLAHAMFGEEKSHLLPLPLEPFRYYQYGERVVHLDGCVEVEAAYYSLPPGWIGRSVKVQWDALHVRILHPHTNQLLREHLRQNRGGYRIEEEDHPKKIPLSTAQLLRRAAHAGTQTGKFCQLLYDRQGETAIRRILGVLSLMKKYGTAAVEDACAAALDIGVYEYRFVRRYLERRPHPQMFLRQIDPLIRELTVYRDFINLKIKEQPE
jgi:Mu transposase, C-terminal domain